MRKSICTAIFFIVMLVVCSLAKSAMAENYTFVQPGEGWVQVAERNHVKSWQTLKKLNLDLVSKKHSNLLHPNQRLRLPEVEKLKVAQKVKAAQPQAKAVATPHKTEAKASRSAAAKEIFYRYARLFCAMTVGFYQAHLLEIVLACTFGAIFLAWFSAAYLFCLNPADSCTFLVQQSSNLFYGALSIFPMIEFALTRPFSTPASSSQHIHCFIVGYGENGKYLARNSDNTSRFEGDTLFQIAKFAFHMEKELGRVQIFSKELSEEEQLELAGHQQQIAA